MEGTTGREVSEEHLPAQFHRNCDTRLTLQPRALLPRGVGNSSEWPPSSFGVETSGPAHSVVASATTAERRSSVEQLAG